MDGLVAAKMKIKLLPSLTFIALCLTLSASNRSLAADSAELDALAKMPGRNSSAPYDGEERIAKAMQIAKDSGKLVLVQSSSEGCTWCHILHKMLTTNTNLAAKIQGNYVYVLVDTTNDKDRAFYKKYAGGTDHTLVLIAMNPGGKQLARMIGDEFVEGGPDHYHINPDTMSKFIDKAAKKK